MPAPDRPLRVALLCYRGKPHCGGQGVYTRHLSRELAALGHEVEVLAGQPWPVLDDTVSFTPLPSLDLYRDPDPFRIPRLREFTDWIDVLEFGLLGTAAFPEPLTFSLRAWRNLKDRTEQFDVVHDNQCLGYGLLGIQAAGLPVVGTIHHPITVDRRLELAAARSLREKVSKARFYGFTRMQTRVAQRLPLIVTVSGSSLEDAVADHGLERERMRVVNVGVDPATFRPLPHVAKVPGRIMTTASADVAMKGLTFLLEAVAKLRTEREVELVVIGRPSEGGPAADRIEALGLKGNVRFVHGVPEERIVELYAEAEVAVVPSLYEGFSLPAVEAQACGVPLVATTGGALPEVVGPDGETALLVPPSDGEALAGAIRTVLDDADLRARIGAAGRERATSRWSWRVAAERTADVYREALDRSSRP